MGTVTRRADRTRQEAGAVIKLRQLGWAIVCLIMRRSGGWLTIRLVDGFIIMIGVPPPPAWRTETQASTSLSPGFFFGSMCRQGARRLAKSMMQLVWIPKGISAGVVGRLGQ